MESQVVNLKGKIQNEGILIGRIKTNDVLSGVMRSDVEIKASVIAPTLLDLKTYSGSYVIYPEVNKIELATSDKRMKDDLTIMEIPYHEVGNEFGETVIIGGLTNGI